MPAPLLEDIAALLLDRGYLSSRDVVSGALRIAMRAGRHVSCVVEAAGTAGYFVKVARDAQGLAFLRTEGLVYQAARDVPGFAALRPHLPHLLEFDAAHGILITSLVPRSCPPLDLSFEDGALDLSWFAAQLGRTLATAHTAPIPDDMAASIDGSQPWALALDAPGTGLLSECWPAQLQLLHELQQHAGACAGLAGARAAWQGDTLVHGDIKFANLLLEATEVEEPPATGRPRRHDERTLAEPITGLRLVDWELAHRGDAAWDVGSVLHAYLAYLVHLVSVEDSAEAPAAAASHFARLLPMMHRHTQPFWDAYRDARGLADTEATALLARATVGAGARLLQTAFEMAGEAVPGRLSAGCLQLGINVLERPDEAQRTLLGLGTGGPRVS